ncbi:hypothetical protein [Streptomyces alboflavus]|uniref:hypothetical protein n=1 Tax=Streptomyces alboflavus TaxID=67267 RepID=UPI00367FADF0
MTRLPHLRPEDRADFEWVLSLALNVTDVRLALEQAATVHDKRQLRARARASAKEIAAAAAGEYRAYRRARAAVVHAPRRDFSRPPTSLGAGALLPALAVLAPLIAATAAAVFLCLGYGIHLVTADSPMASSLITAGWMTALTAGISTVIGLSGLLTRALHRRPSPVPPLTVRNPEAERARDAWQQALLERGMLPYLRLQLSVSPPHPQ